MDLESRVPKAPAAPGALRLFGGVETSLGGIPARLCDARRAAGRLHEHHRGPRMTRDQEADHRLGCAPFLKEAWYLKQIRAMLK